MCARIHPALNRNFMQKIHEFGTRSSNWVSKTSRSASWMVCLLDLPVIRFFQLSWETKVIGATWKLEGVLSHALFLYMKPCMLYIYRGFFLCVCVFWTICSFKSIGSFSWEFITVEDLHAWCATKVGSANLERSYRRAPKGAGQGGYFQVEGGGVCHLCLCGQGTDWENLTL